jgi:hypothetical protein
MASWIKQQELDSIGSKKSGTIIERRLLAETDENISGTTLPFWEISMAIRTSQPNQCMPAKIEVAKANFIRKPGDQIK